VIVKEMLLLMIYWLKMKRKLVITQNLVVSVELPSNARLATPDAEVDESTFKRIK
jgi:hypothetical protein